MTFGARMLKTGMAVTLSLYICSLFGFSGPVIAAVAAIFAMQPSIYRSWRYFLDQLQTNTLGAAIAMLAGTLLSNEPFAIGLICILVIMICMKMKMEETVGLTLVTVIAVMDASGQWDFALNRFLLSLIGIVSAFMINITFLPPKPQRQIVKQINLVFARLSLLLRTAISKEMKENVYRAEQMKLEEELKQLADKYKLMEEELKKIKRGKRHQTRQLVVYKHMLIALKKGLAALNTVEQHYFQGAHTAETDKLFDSHLEKLIKFHEHVLLKFDNKLKPDADEARLFEEENVRFMSLALEKSSVAVEGAHRLSVVAAAIYDYGHHTGRLERLIERYHRSVVGQAKRTHFLHKN